jgi:hypothetical protein
VKARGPVLPGRAGHSMTIFGSKVFIFGGQAGTEFMNDLWTFDLASRKCIGLLASHRFLTVSSVRTEPQWARYEHNTLHKPAKRTGHVCVAYKNQMIL